MYVKENFEEIVNAVAKYKLPKMKALKELSIREEVISRCCYAPVTLIREENQSIFVCSKCSEECDVENV